MRSALRLLPLLVCASCSLVSLSSAQEQLTPEDREYYDLHLSFAAKVRLNDGKTIELTDFHIGSGRFRHMLLTGGNQSVNVPLRAIARITRIGGSNDRIVMNFVGGPEMTTSWADPEYRLIYGMLPGGERWRGAISGVRQIEIWQVKQEDQEKEDQ